MSPIAVPDVIPRIKRFNPSSSSREGVADVVDPPSVSAAACNCSASRYRCPTGVLTLPAAVLNGGTKPGIVTMVSFRPIVLSAVSDHSSLVLSIVDREMLIDTEKDGEKIKKK
jgi:hypothetical protein